MKVFGNTQLFGIMGHPVDHTLSPVMHNAAFEALGVNAVYVPLAVKPGFSDAHQRGNTSGVHFLPRNSRR